MPDRDIVITHLQIIHTWASYAHERNLQFFTRTHLEDIAQWSDDAINLLKEQRKLIDDTPHWVFGNSYGHAWMKCSNCCVSQSGQTGCWSYCPNCGARMEGQVEWDD